ncbi:hypothetical protein L6164_036030 [Bauhinia variegata]|uniref:Uncharacterized protein n=1 Tax=Bauhinia variegata TaxID=167791 RepID=A0ACB9KFV0_BAUVA|nr:hypothetical protein L6164_036030 [Bauhinia variegata]
MGNCVAFHQSFAKKQTRGSPIDEGITEPIVLMPVKKISHAPHKRYVLVHRDLRSGEIHYLEPLLTQSVKPLVPCKTSDGRNMRVSKVKILVTREQSQLLLTGAKSFQTRSRVSQLSGRSRLKGCQKWQPTLPSIPEVHASQTKC